MTRIAAILPLLVVFVARTTEAQGTDPAILQRVFTDDFSEDTRSAYKIDGNVIWKQGLLTLKNNAAVERAFNGSSWAKIELAQEHARLTKEQTESELRVRFVLDGATSGYVRLRTTMTDSGPSVTMDLVDTGQRNGKTIEFVVRRVVVPQQDTNRLSIEYRSGLVRVMAGQNERLLGYIDKRFAKIAGIKIEATTIVSLGMLAVVGERPEAKVPSDLESRQLAEARTARSKLIKLYGQGKFADAAAIGESVLQTHKDVFGKRHPNFANSLNNQAVLYLNMGDYARAEPLCKQSLEIHRTLYGAQHPRYANSLSSLAGMYERMGDYERAKPLFQQTVEIQEAVFGEMHPRCAASLCNLAEMCVKLGEYDHSESLLKRALTIRESFFGNRHPEYASSLDHLGAMYYRSGDYERAEPLYMKALQIRESVLGVTHPRYADSLNNLAVLYESKGDYTRAETLHKQSIEIGKSVLGEKHPEYAAGLNNLASLYRRMGDYVRAEPLVRKSVDIKKLAVGVKHPSYAASLVNLAAMYGSMGDYARAEPLHKQALEIRKSALGENHPIYAASLYAFAGLYLRKGDYARAAPLYERAIEIQKLVLGEKHPEYANSLSNLAECYRVVGDYAQAERLIKQAMAIRGSVLGEKHPSYALSLNNLAGLLETRGDYAQAEPFYQQAREIWLSELGEQHPYHAASLNNLAGLYISMGDDVRADALAHRAVGIVQKNLDRGALVQSQRQQRCNQSTQRAFLDKRLCVALRSRVSAAEVLPTVWQWKGAVTFRQQAYRRFASDPEISPAFELLRLVSRQTSALWGSAPEAPNTTTKAALEIYRQKRKRWKTQLASLDRKREDLEQRIAVLSPAFRELREPLTLAAVQETLPAGTAFVDFLEYNDATSVPSPAGKAVDARRIIAFVVRSNGESAVIDLGSAELISAAISAFRRPFVAEYDTRESREHSSAAAKTLRDILWNPIEEHLEGIETVVISPDTALGTLPFAALPGKESGSFLIEDYALVGLPMARLLPVLLRSSTPVTNGGLLLLGDVDYSAISGSGNSGVENREQLAIDYERGWFAATNGNSRRWASLPGFRNEFESVRSLYQRRFGSESPIVTLSGAEATANSFIESAMRARTLHVITHGYFEKPSVKSIHQVFVKADNALEGGPDPFIDTWTPGLLSGLVMAGANGVAQDADALEDGILYASEIEAVSMVGVDLVVLSACETGLGPVAGGEGLTGLRRAFHVAGARSVIASLWKVDDRATEELMRRFYTNLWLKGMSKIEALRKAQIWMLNHPNELTVLGVNAAQTRGTVRLRKPDSPGDNSDNRTSPYFWAAFSLSGDWR